MIEGGEERRGDDARNLPPPWPRARLLPPSRPPARASSPWCSRTRSAPRRSTTFADLQQRYPAVLGRRKAEAQPIEIADKGIWHRLVVLPAGSRQSASGLCDQLQAAGYDRCWVKAY